jgi:segregation and condensation protein B
MNSDELTKIVEAALLAAGRPLSLDNLLALFEEREDRPAKSDIREALERLRGLCEARGVELQEVATGFRFQVRKEYAPWISSLFADRPTRYSRAFMETLALIAYRQPITRGEIEDIRGVSVSSSILKSLHEREWVRVLGHREVPGRPAMLGTTKKFLDDFNLKTLESLPPLAEIRDLESVHRDLFPDQPFPIEAQMTPSESTH